MMIKISPDGFIHLSGDVPEVGKTYSLEDATEGTGAKRRTWHALAQEYWTSGAHSYRAKTFMEFREYLKRDLGAGFESYVCATPDGIVKSTEYEDMIATLNKYGIVDIKKFVLGKLKSMAKYTKKEWISAIDRLIAEMIQAGVQTEKFFAILEEIQS